MRTIIGLVVLTAVIGGSGFWYMKTHSGPRTVFNVAEVHRGHLEATVGSTGTLQPREVVDVGAQVVGRIISIGKDENTKSGIVEWGSEVVGPPLDEDGKPLLDKDGKPMLGTILAQIDPLLYEAARNCSQGVRGGSPGGRHGQNRHPLPGDARLEPRRNAARSQRRGPGGVRFVQGELYELATANLELSKANVDLQKANLKTAQTNLDYATISAPVNGVVVDRRVNVGQTVVASLSAPSLFLIAKDLTKMEVWATVNEVDVGKIVAGQDVKFTVDAFPGRVYHGKVVPQGKLPFRLNATMNQNVVTYTVVVSVDNEDRKLSPYLTTNLTFIVADKKDVLLVPNAALRWQPTKRADCP